MKHKLLKFSILSLVFLGFVYTCKKLDLVKVAYLSEPVVSDTTYTSATVKAKIVDIGEGITEHGFCWDTKAEPDINSLNVTKNGPATDEKEYNSVLANLIPNTTYFIRAFALNTKGDTIYGKQGQFNTKKATKPSLTTIEPSEIKADSAKTGGNITSDGGSPITEKGICWGLTSNPDLTNHLASPGTETGSFSLPIAGLNPNTTYYVRAYATNSNGMTFGSEYSFSTSINFPEVSTVQVTNITLNSAIAGGNITSDGGAAITARGICYSTSENPSLIDKYTTEGTGTGEYASSLTGLNPNTTYYVKAYATNIAGTSYGEQKSFKTLDNTPTITKATITTNGVTNISTVSAQLTGTAIGEGITEKGYCWNTSGNPTTNNNTAKGFLNTTITGLEPNTTYYVKAYAINSAGTAYGNEISFTTKIQPVLNYGTVTDVEDNVYKTIGIGSQIWMAENLKTTKYNDDTSIPNVTDNTAWSGMTIGAYCWYNNNIANKTTYGALYNWYTVTDTHNLCPTGWHVPSDAEWTTLTDYLGGAGIAGGKMKEIGITHWISPNSGATNESGFTALPGGYRDGNGGAFGYLGGTGYGWSSTVGDAADAWDRDLDYFGASADRTSNNRRYGFSVRCLKD